MSASKEKKEKNKERSRRYYIANRERIKARCKEYDRANPEKRRKWREEHAESRKEYARKWWSANKDDQREKSKRWYVENKSKRREYFKQYTENNRARLKEKAKQWAKNNKEKIKQIAARRRSKKAAEIAAYMTGWRNANRDRVRANTVAANHRRRSKEHNCEGSHTAADARIVRSILGRACLRCGAVGPTEIDHVVPLAGGGSNGPLNLQVLCAKCNRAKGAKNSTDYRTKAHIDSMRIAFHGGLL